MRVTVKNAKDHEELIQRPKTLSDDATPSGNGIAAFALAPFGYLLGETKYLKAADRTLQFAAQSISQSPIGHSSLSHSGITALRSADYYSRGSRKTNKFGNKHATRA